MKKYLILSVLLLLVLPIILSDYVIQPEIPDELVFDESLSTESYAVYTNRSYRKLVIDGSYDKYRLENGSLSDSDYSIVDFAISKSRFNVRFGEKTPSINFSYGVNSLKFKFIGYGLYDLDDGDYVLLNNPNDITPSVSGNSIVYENIIDSVDVSYTVNKSGANKLITFNNRSRDSLPDGYSDNTFIVFVEKIEGDYPKSNSSFGELLFDDVMIPDLDDVYKRVITRSSQDFLLTAIRFDRYNSSSFPFSIDPTLTPSDADVFFGTWGDNNGDAYSSVEITGSKTVYVGASNCSTTTYAVESDCSWFVNVSGHFYLEDGSSISGSSRGRIKSEGVGQGSDYFEVNCGGGGAGGYGAGGQGGSSGAAGGSAYNTTVPSDYGSLYPPWAGSGGGIGDAAGADGGKGGAGIYVEASNISIEGDIYMNGQNAPSVNAQNEGAGGGGSGGSIILKADDLSLGSSSSFTANGGQGGENLATCYVGWDATGGGGAGGGWIEFHYANFVNGSFVSIIGGIGGESVPEYDSGSPCNYPGGNGTAGSFYDNQFNAAPNFTEIPLSSSNPSVGNPVILSANVSSQSPLHSSDYVKECNFSVWQAGFYHVNHSNASVAQDFQFNYSYTPMNANTYYWNVTCYDSGNLNTLDDSRGIASIDGGFISPFVPDDSVNPELIIDFPTEGLTVTTTDYENKSVAFNLYTYDLGGIGKLEYSFDGGTSNSTNWASEYQGASVLGFNCVGKSSCSYNATVDLSTNISSGGSVDYSFWWYLYDNSGNINYTNVNFTLTIPSAPSGEGPGGGGGGTPDVVVIEPHCGNGVCEPELGESIFNCREDCATLAIFTTGEIFEQAVVVNYFIIALIILGLALGVPREEYAVVSSGVRREFRRLRGKIL